MDHDGSVQHASAIEPIGSCEGGECPTLLTLHGTTVPPQNQADSYKRMVGEKFQFGVQGMWLLAPTRYGGCWILLSADKYFLVLVYCYHCYTHTHTHTHTHKGKQAGRQAHRITDRHTHAHYTPPTHTHTHTHVHTHTHTHRHAGTHTHTHTHICTLTRYATHTHTYTENCMHTWKYTHRKKLMVRHTSFEILPICFWS